MSFVHLPIENATYAERLTINENQKNFVEAREKNENMPGEENPSIINVEYKIHSLVTKANELSSNYT